MDPGLRHASRASLRQQTPIFDLAAEEDALVFAHHFPPYPNLGHTRKQEQGWQWQPIERQG